MAASGYADADDSSGDELSVVEPTGAPTEYSKTAPRTVEQAQRALMVSLKKPRKSFKNLDRDYGAQAEIVATDGRVIKPS